MCSTSVGSGSWIRSATANIVRGTFSIPLRTMRRSAPRPGYLREKAYLAVCRGYDAAGGTAVFVQRNKVSVGETVEILSPGHPGRGFVIGKMTDSEGNDIPSAPHPFMEFAVPVPFAVKEGDIMRSAGMG